MKIGDLIRISDEGAMNIDEVGVSTGTVGIIVKIEPPVYPRRDMGDLHTVIIIANNRRIPYLLDHEMEKLNKKQTQTYSI